ncbi:hypothetical protein [Wolbachia endosymbiont (group A) of Brachyopa scutellaris]|uniref:hypothetical protein n=1 Tax=Wolbachia endosymbiont (group A) of Brachyopa scutellaris TaxID=3066140 RepID=UPI0031334E2A
MDRRDISEVLFSSIKENDSYRASKLLQIERWCYAHWKIHAGYGEIRNNFLAQVLSNEDCWEKVNNLHQVKLNRQMVGKKLIAPSSDSKPNPFGTDRYKIACDCCLEDEIRAIFEERKEELSAQGNDSLLEYHHLVRCYGEGPIAQFWSHFISGYLDKLDLRGRHLYEYGLDCAVGWRKVEAVEFFWNKIKSLPENEMSAQKKDEIFMKNVIYAAKSHCNSYPEIFEFFFDQLTSDRYPELLKRDFAQDNYYDTLFTLKDSCSFDKLRVLFDCLHPSDILERHFYSLLRNMNIQSCQEYYAKAGIELFTHMWTKEGFDSHRAFTLQEELVENCGFILYPLVSKGYMEPVWEILDKANPNQIKEFMDSKKDHICSILLGNGDSNSLNRFLSYGKSADEERNPKNIPGPSGDLTEVEVRKTHASMGK